ncbi:DUF4238 domain-containing protein [Corallococcus sp. AB018]|uniref:DUF4238 domain-containing protein n=1 Tax=Corallococcus sp. AB018 TaxID=2316715 RepID=UPI000F87DF4D|nr:DUF4238 domain-containing protein [Corallococcus sp. AB018]RUO93096.1 DUF4238 domain-containing protein [Corallococcus sp. AB018]
MSEPRRHHVVPQMHLKRFADHKHRIVMVSRDQKKRFKLATKEACVQTDYYAVETETGRTQEMEGILSLIESEAAEAIKLMLSGKFPPSPKDREAVAMFIGFQCVRGDEARQGYEQLVDMMTKKSVVEYLRKQEGREPTEEEIKAQRLLLSNLDATTIKLLQNVNIMIMLELGPRFAEYMVQRSWILVDHGEPCLLTSDTPVARWSKPTGPGDFVVHGYGTADQIRMPLSPRHSLVLDRNEGLEERVLHMGCKLGPELGATLNKLVAYNARRWIFHHPDTDPLRGITLPPADPVLRIG